MTVPPGWPVDGTYVVGDFNRDGADDIALLPPDGVWNPISVNLRKPKGWWWWRKKIADFSGDGSYFVGDFNGNGADDIGFLRSDGTWYIVDSNSGDPMARWSGVTIPGLPGDGTYVVGDFNGDGADDIAFLPPDGRWQIVNGDSGTQNGGQVRERRVPRLSVGVDRRFP